jgi:exonuclease SbcD
VRVLHTSDWHLGTSIEQVDCGPEHERFLDWLTDTIREREIDVLVVSGDIFHYQNPGSQDEKRYYDFLVECARLKTLRHVVIVAGNHDSPSGLEAPAAVLSALDVTVVGRIPRDREDWDQCLVPIEGDSGEVELVVAAVPYVREAQLGVRTQDDGETGRRERYRQAFADLYGNLAQRAAENWPDAAKIATGHLTVYGSNDEPQEGDYHTGIHRTRRPKDDASVDAREVGAIQAMDPGIFGDGWDYVALGHIHRPMPVGGRRDVRYSGTPVATTKEEDTPRRQVVEVSLESQGQLDLTGQGDIAASIETIQVPAWREIFELEGTETELAETLANLEFGGDLPPAIYTVVKVPADELVADHLSAFQEVLNEAFDRAEDRPIIVDVRQKRVGDEDAEDGQRALPPIEEMDHIDVFCAMYKKQNPEANEPNDRLLDAFREIVAEYQGRDEGER